MDLNEDEDYICSTCEYEKEYNKKPICNLCGYSDDLLIPMEYNKKVYVHAYCAYFVPGYEINDGLAHIEDRVIYGQFSGLMCQFCSKKGGCVQCTYKQCTTAFHISCGRRRGCIIKTNDDENVYLSLLIDM